MVIANFVIEVFEVALLAAVVVCLWQIKQKL